jgi:uncharacterized protein YecE (DUF72 family)
MLKVGCCGFPCGMDRYFGLFRLVEVQSIFYSLPKHETARGWRERAPKHFEFTAKAWQLITHPPSSPTYRRAKLRIPLGREEYYGFFKPTDEVHEAWERTRVILDILGARIAVFQCPSSFVQVDENIENMSRFFNSVERGRLRFAWEPRGKWDSKLIEDLCDTLDLIHVIDPLHEEMAYVDDTIYFRLHGARKDGRIDYGYRYVKKDLQRLLRICSGLGAKEIYCLFNNRYMFDNAIEFEAMARDVF